MLKLYHGDTSVCSIKVRIALFEKGLAWESALVDLLKGEHRTAEYLELNPEGVVPTLIDDGFVVRESSAIIEHVDRLDPRNPLMPEALNAQTTTRMWLVRTIDIHAAINTMSFAALFRERELANNTPQQTEEKLARMPNPQAAAKRRDLYANGTESVYLHGALHTLNLMLKDMQTALAQTQWLAGNAYSLSDIALIAYVDRLERLAMDGLWKTRFPAVGDWLIRSRARPSYDDAVRAYISDEIADKHRKTAAGYWPAIARRLQNI